ncbi:MAG: hypothetical protein LJE64_06135 [Desulfofustis sp.]|jgi:GAF domain-containing protein|nr:hypothetical protein [Desulfofustis sp.]
MAGQTLAFSNDDLPGEAEIDIRSRRYFGVESTVVIPLQVGGQPVIGCISFETLNRVRAWKEDEVNRLKLVADVFANALVRRRTVEDLIESQERLTLATESAEAGVWELDCSTGVIWTTARGRKIFGYGADGRQ